jgi:hypothetical protein
MISISGTFSYQPPSQKLIEVFPATFSIALAIVNDDGVPVLDQRNQLDRLSATVIIGYPQISLGDAFPLKLKSFVFGPPPPNFVHVSGEFDVSRTTAPPAGWMPAAILIQLDNTWTAVITAAAPAAPNSGIAFPEREGTFPAQEGQIDIARSQG